MPGGAGAPIMPGGAPIMPGGATPTSGGGGIPMPAGGIPGGIPGGPAPGGAPAGPAANMVCGLCVVVFFSMFAASNRSAGVPCLSPFVSFLYAYVTEIGRLHKN